MQTIPQIRQKVLDSLNSEIDFLAVTEVVEFFGEKPAAAAPFLAISVWRGKAQAPQKKDCAVLITAFMDGKASDLELHDGLIELIDKVETVLTAKMFKFPVWKPRDIEYQDPLLLDSQGEAGFIFKMQYKPIVEEIS